MIFWIVLFFQQTLAAPICRPSQMSCGYYRCAEEKLQCGEENYLTQFGGFFCEEYKANESKFSQSGQTWLQEVRLCLQKELERGLGSGLVCSEIEDFALNSHVGCYLETGYCALDFTDQLLVMSIGSKDAHRGNFSKRLQTLKKIEESCSM